MASDKSPDLNGTNGKSNGSSASNGHHLSAYTLNGSSNGSANAYTVPNGRGNGHTNGNKSNGASHNNPNANKDANKRKRVTDTFPRVRAGTGLKYAHIIGWGMKVPETIITNEDLAAVVETSDEWIRSRTGIQQRRFASERDSVVTMGFEAARSALDRAYLLPTEIDLIIVATSTPEDIYPSTACKIQNLLGASKAGAFDLSAACSGFVYAMNMAAQAIRSGSITNALIIGSEANSRVMDWSDRATCILFGDGAGAIVMQGRDEPGGWQSCVLGSDGSGADLLGIPTVGYAIIPEGRQLHKLHMDGREVFRFATHVINESIREAVEKAGLTLADIALIIPHQANQRILSAAARSLNLPEALFYSNVHRYGNTSAASIPIALCEAEREGRLKPNDNIIMIGFGGGLTWATAVMQWQTVPQPEPHGISYRLLQGRREAVFIFAFWRDRVMKLYRRLEAILKGSPVKTANIRENKAQSRSPEKVLDKTEKPVEKSERTDKTPKATAPIPTSPSSTTEKAEKTAIEKQRVP